MPPDIDLSAAAQRHFIDAKHLHANKKYDNAGYHFGWAAECAVKSLLQKSGIFDGDAVMWAHFPKLRALAAIARQGRGAAPLKRLVDDPAD